MSPWHENIKKINGLWPDANWTPEESAFYRKQLEQLDQDWLYEAIEEVRVTYSSKKPELKWFMDVYNRVKDDRTFHQRVAKDRAHKMNDDGISDSEIAAMRKQLELLTEQEQEKLCKRLSMACGMQLDFTKPIEEWSNFRIALAHSALE